MKMTTAMKTLMVAAIGALAIGNGAAMAQSGTTIYPGVGFLPPQVINNGQAPEYRPNQVQSGGSDTNINKNPDEYRYQWGNLNNPN